MEAQRGSSAPVLIYWSSSLVMAAFLFSQVEATLGIGVLAGVLAALLLARALDKRAQAFLARSTRNLAYYDDLTGLPNRRLFFQQLSACLARPIGRDEFTAVLFLDLDKFKGINDALGHLAGDRFLVEISSRIKSCLGNDALLARFAGDEFTILVESVKSREELTSLAERIMSQFDGQVQINGEKIWANASMGVAMVRAPRPSADDLLSMADAALYHAKAAGRGRYVLFEPNLPIPTARSLSLDADIRKAVQARQFVLHYQPIVDLRDLSIQGLEALIRWTHPKFGLLTPDEFIYLAEETGVINSLGDWVIETACERISAWQSLYGETLTISVNLSALQFRQRDLLSHIALSSRRAGLRNASLQLEITESVLMQDDKDTLKTLDELRDLGFSIVIDDFGVGYSSLSYLRLFEIDVLKLDRSFIARIDEPRSRSLAAGTIQLGHGLGARVVAEGIETLEQLEFLRLARCDLGQGFLLGRPMTEKQLFEYATLHGLNIDLEPSSPAA